MCGEAYLNFALLRRRVTNVPGIHSLFAHAEDGIDIEGDEGMLGK